MGKENLLNLIDLNIDSAFTELDKVFSSENAKYFALCEEYYAPPNNFSLLQFKSKLKRFVSMNMIVTNDTIPEKNIDNIYDILCDLNYKEQEKYFHNIYKHKKVCAFFLYGENDMNGNDLRWCYHQLFKTDAFRNVRPVSIDFTGNINNSFNSIIEVLCSLFKIDIDHKDLTNCDLRFEIQKFLETSHLVLIIKHPKTSCDLISFYDSFITLFSYLSKEIGTRTKHSVIFLIVENDRSNYDNLKNDYFFWHHENKGGSYSKFARETKEPKIIDLSPIEKITETLITEWLDKYSYIDNVKKKLASDYSIAEVLIRERDNPFHIIQAIYNELKIDAFKKADQWLTY